MIFPLAQLVERLDTWIYLLHIAYNINKPPPPFTSRHFSQATVSIKLSNFLIYLCNFDLSCPILEKDCFIENLYTDSCLVLLISGFYLFLFILLFFNLVLFRPSLER